MPQFEMTKIKPINNFILIQIKEEEKIGSIFIPNQVVQFIDHGVVLAVAEEIEDIAVGSVVYFKHYAGRELEKNILLIPREDILAKKD